MEELFRPCGDFREVRMQHFANGQQRNFCYVEFFNEQVGVGVWGDEELGAAAAAAAAAAGRARRVAGP